MKKRIAKAVGTKKYFLLGYDQKGIPNWLASPVWDCDWYWGFGYIQTFSNPEYPELAKDVCSHWHYDSILKRGVTPETFKEYFPETPLTDREIWKLTELMESFYILRKYSDMLYSGNAHITENPCADIIRENKQEYNRINKIVIPAITQAIEELLSPDKKGD